MVASKIKDRIKQSTNLIAAPYYKLKRSIKQIADPYYELHELIDKSWRFLPKEEKEQISKFVRNNIYIIKRFYNPPSKKKILDSLNEYAHYTAPSIDFHSVDRYFRDIRNLDDLIEAVKDGYFPFRKYYVVTKPRPEDHYIEFAFGINTKSGKQKEILTEVLEIIGEIMSRGYPACYYGEYNYYPIQYYIEKSSTNDDNNQNRINVRIFIRRDIPDAIAGYLLYKVNNMKHKNTIVPPSGNQYFLFEDQIRMGINPDPNDPYISNIFQSFNTLKKIY
jgi:hypothetical protein